jgi:hypothetical protein
LLHPEELQRHFEEEAPLSAKHPSCYARNLLEYCCFQALSVAVQVTDHLSDKEFRRLSFDMMLAWELPSATSRQVAKNEQEYQTQHRGPSVEDDEDAGFFYSGLTPMMVYTLSCRLICYPALCFLVDASIQPSHYCYPNAHGIQYCGMLSEHASEDCQFHLVL